MASMIQNTTAIDIFIALRAKNQLHLSLDFISHGKGVPCERIFHR